MKILKEIKFQYEMFLLGFPNGLLYVIEEFEAGRYTYTLWDRIRYRLYTGKNLSE